MLFAERHRKLGRDGSLAHDRAEDLLTSTAFQLLRYIPLEAGLLAVLRRVRAVQSDGEVIQDPPPWLTLDEVTAAEYRFWPRWERGQPDVVITLLKGQAPVGRLVVEVKLDSGKSGDAEVGDETEMSRADQLWRYWRGLNEDDGPPGLGVVYLTTHAAPPHDELRRSVTHEPGCWLGWLSWRDIWLEMNDSRGFLPAADLADTLEAKGLNAFNGFSRCKPPSQSPPSPTFWAGGSMSPNRWFQNELFRTVVSPHFWHRSTE